MRKVFRDYVEMGMEMLEGYTIVKAQLGASEDEGDGILLCLERQISNATLGVDIIYAPNDLETPLVISEEFVKFVHED